MKIKRKHKSDESMTEKKESQTKNYDASVFERSLKHLKLLSINLPPNDKRRRQAIPVLSVQALMTISHSHTDTY